jgi:hypothetical protein
MPKGIGYPKKALKPKVKLKKKKAKPKIKLLRK